MTRHEQYMQRCLQLAAQGAGFTAPNPMVGAVLVHDDIIISEGWHQQYGSPHAEVNCINNVKAEDRHLIADSILYVSLEPCNHFGKTPPCTDLILKENIRQVVIGSTDTNKTVNGSGIAKLQQAGVQVITNVLEKECRELNKRFFSFHEKKRPYIILKWAQTADGYIANADKSRLHISNDIANTLVHKWRSEEAAILIGFNTAIMDNPMLTNRSGYGKHPLRIVTGDKSKLPASLNVFNEIANTLVIEKKMPAEICTAMYEQNLLSVLIEGGTKTLQAFIDSGLWDEARIITNEQMRIANGYKAPLLSNNKLLTQENIGNNKIDFFANNLQQV